MIDTNQYDLNVISVIFIMVISCFSIWVYRLSDELNKIKKAEGSIVKENNELVKFKHTLDKILDSVFMFDADSLKFTYVNEGAVSQVGYSHLEMMNMHPYDIKPEFSESEFRELIKAIMLDEKLMLNFETVHKAKAGEIIPVEIFMQYIEALDESPLFIAIVRDIGNRKKIENELLESKLLLEKAQKISKVGHWRLNPDTQEVSGSDELFRIFGLSRKFFMIESFFDVVHKDDRERVMAMVESSLESGESLDEQHRLIMTDRGEEKWVRSIGDAITDEHGKVVELVGTVQDITEQKLKENEIKASQDRFKLILESIPDAVLIIDSEKKIKLVNESFREIFLYSKDDVIGQEFDFLYLVAEGEKEDMQFMSLDQGGYEFNYVRKDGKTFHGETTVTDLASKNKNDQKQLVIIKDVSERRLVNKVLHSLAVSGTGLQFEKFIGDVVKQLSEFYRCEFAFVGQLQDDRLSVKTLSVYANGKIVDNYIYDLADTPCEDVINREKTLIPESASKIYAKNKMLTNLNIEGYFGAPLVSSDGQIIGLLSVMSTSQIYLDNWVSPVLSVFATRISLELEREIASLELREHHQQLEIKVLERTKELSLARDEAEQASKIKSEFLSHMSHELRTPLNAILGFAQMLELDAADFNEDQCSGVQEILEAGRHLLALINDVLDLAKIESGKLNVDTEEVEVKGILEQCLAIIFIQAKESNIEIINMICKENYRVSANAMRLKQVLLNLLSNAIKYNLPGGKIILHSRLIDDENLRICISDTGKGLTEKEMSQLFIAFDRLGVSSNIEGSGIGLLISKQMVEIMQGEMGVESVKGKGSTFWVQFKLV